MYILHSAMFNVGVTYNKKISLRPNVVRPPVAFLARKKWGHCGAKPDVGDGGQKVAVYRVSINVTLLFFESLCETSTDFNNIRHAVAHLHFSK